MGAMDSSSELLFRVSADASEAGAEMAQLRSLVSGNLAGMASDFKGFSGNVFGEMNAGKGMFLAASVAIVAGSASIVSALHGAAQKAADFALEIEGASEKAAIGVEDMSRLRYAAEVTQTPFEALERGLTFFATTVDKARDATSQQAEALHRLGIGQAEIEAGAQNVLPLFYRVADAFRNDATLVERSAMARAIFSRGGPELVEFLKRGSDALRQFGDDAERLGKVITEKDVVAAKELKAAMLELRAQKDALALEAGQLFIPLETGFLVAVEGMIAGLKSKKWGAVDFISSVIGGMWASAAKIQQQVQAGMKEAGQGLGPPGGEGEGEGEGKGVKQTTRDFGELSSMLDQVKQRLAATRGEESQMIAEFGSMQRQMNAAHTELLKLAADGKIAPDVAKREIEAFGELARLMPELVAQEMKALAEKRNAAIASANEDLQQQLAGQQQGSWAQEEAGWNEQMDKLAARMRKEQTLTEENERVLAELREAGLRRIDRERGDAFTRELVDLQQQLAQIVTVHFTSAERLNWQYGQDLMRFSQAEEEKLLAVTKGEGAQESVRQMYALMRAAALKRYQTELQTLYNSQGWQGLFGSFFANAIRGNEELLRQWAESSNQSLLMVKVAMESLDEMGQRAFANFAQGMAQNIANALVYEKSIGAAMAAATKAALAQLAAEAYVQAIFATAFGFIKLAQWDFAGAANAFTAAAIFATVGTAAALTGRAIPSGDKGAAKAGGGAAAGSSSGSASGAGGSGSSSSKGSVTIYVQGPIIGRSGIEEITDLINDAVEGRDVRLIATAVRQPGQVTR